VDVLSDGATTAKAKRGEESSFVLEQAKEEDWLAANILKPCLKQARTQEFCCRNESYYAQEIHTNLIVGY